MRLVADVGSHVWSDVSERVEGAEREVDYESTNDHQNAANDNQTRRPFAKS